jgi:hypothetical protein
MVPMPLAKVRRSPSFADWRAFLATQSTDIIQRFSRHFVGYKGVPPIRPDSGARSAHAVDHARLQDQLSKLAALVDHYYAAYRETRALLDRRDRQLAELRRKLNSAPVALRR